MDKLFCTCRYFRLACSNGVECYQQLVVHISCIVEERPDDLLYAQKAFGKSEVYLSSSGVSCVFWPYAIGIAIKGVAEVFWA